MHLAPRYTIAHVPFLRLLLPIIIGIVWQHLFPSQWIIGIWFLVALGCGIATWILRHDRLKRTFHIAFTTATTSAVIGAGMLLYQCKQPSAELPEMSATCVAIAKIEEVPVKKEYSYRTVATIISLNDSTATRATHIPVLLNLNHSYTAGTLQGGNLIIFKPQLQRIEPSPIPYAFDYAQYMKARGILYRQSLADEQWQLASYSTTPTLQQRAQIIQSQCVGNLHDCGLSQENTALLSALLWGYKTDLPTTTREYFSAAGLSHVLAVSGLHTGIIALIISWLLFPLRYTKLRKLSHVIVIITLWIYAFIAGLSPSIIRACIMATFVGVALLINRRNTALNALCASALLVLLFDPMQLFEIGFQLSYAAVAGILLLAPYFDIARILEAPNSIVRYLSQLISVSLAAQIATTPIAAYYFHYIPLWGLLSNIIFVPLLPFIIIATLILQMCNICLIPHTWITIATDTLVNGLTGGANLIASLPGATLNEIWLSPLFLVLYYTIIFCIWHAVSYRTLRPLTVIVASLIIMLISLTHQSLQPSTAQAFITNNRNNTHLQLADDKHHCYIISTDTTSQPPTQGNEWRIKEQFDTRKITPDDTIQAPNIYIALPFVQYYNNRMLWVDDNTWRYTRSNRSMHIDYAVITEQYKGRIKPLINLFEIDTIILSASIFPEKAEQLRQECIAAEIDCLNLREEKIWHCIPNRQGD